MLSSTLKSGPIPLYVTPTLALSAPVLSSVAGSTRMEGIFFSEAMTTPLVALMPSEVRPDWTALRAYSIWTSLPEGEKVVREKSALDMAVEGGEGEWKERMGWE